MKRVSALIFCFVLMSGGAVYAQTAKPGPLPAAPKPLPQLTKVQKTEAEVLVSYFKDDETSIAKLRADEAKITADYQDYLKKIEAAYPGYTVDIDHTDGLGHSDPILKEKTTPPTTYNAPKK